MSSHNDWRPDTWRARPAMQLPPYADPTALRQAEGRLSGSPSLIFPGEVSQLRTRLAAVASRKAFLLQGGDCAESFDEFGQQPVESTFRVILQMAVVLTYAAACPVVKVGRIAGQFAKPRSSETEVHDGTSPPSYRGDVAAAPGCAGPEWASLRERAASEEQRAADLALQLQRQQAHSERELEQLQESHAATTAVLRQLEARHGDAKERTARGKKSSD
jgi:3-deoxy-D-arabino-heptulosonate 7-phosphate (DAHP) synthase class II